MFFWHLHLCFPIAVFLEVCKYILIYLPTICHSITFIALGCDFLNQISFLVYYWRSTSINSLGHQFLDWYTRLNYPCVADLFWPDLDLKALVACGLGGNPLGSRIQKLQKNLEPVRADTVSRFGPVRVFNTEPDLSKPVSVRYGLNRPVQHSLLFCLYGCIFAGILMQQGLTSKFVLFFACHLIWQ